MTAVIASRGATILCVEDEADFREDIADELRDAGFLVLEAPCAQDALSMLKCETPDLILCDITMPGMDGYQFLAAVRQSRPELADIPIVFLTAQSEANQIVRGKMAGADDYLIKPVDFDLMLATLCARLAQVSRIRKRHSLEMKEIQDALHQISRQGGKVSGPLARAFDYVGFGIVLLDQQGTVWLANRAAHRMASNVRGMMLDGRLTLGYGREASEFHTVFSNVLAAARRGEDRVECLPLARNDGSRDLLCMVGSLIDDALEETEGAAIMLIMSDPATRPPLMPSMLESLFGLTPTEAQIASAFADGLRTDEIATRFEISPTTVAFHKRNLFDKTQTRRQADLIALLLALPAYVPAQ